MYITNFESNEDSTLALTFSNSHRLTMLDSSKEYESYDITRPGQTIIVLVPTSSDDAITALASRRPE